ncbi:hypothetical protein SUGI_0117650 [Cryptomeria japonica]|uniref:rust resistance kinase Lr10 n=1 Tax=Cryptomeria japonica TaxID=3369 RepID=UPI002408A30E|nr:rust resistance kinase Lr10 [Cryptomeria japonica]GLJ09878.1 hypothetical protein SUGI_0117650 [Cryptomeria japonica]
MEMEGLDLHFFIPLLIISLSCLAPSSRACEEPLECGNRFFEYPFGRKNSGCGDPALQLDCDLNVKMPLIDINGYQYYIVEPQAYMKGDPDHHMRIVEKSMWGDTCNPVTGNHSTEFWSKPPFHISEEFMDLSLWGECGEGEENRELLSNISHTLECNKNWYYSFTSDLSLSTYCKSLVRLPIRKSDRSNSRVDRMIQKGFTIAWNFSKACEDCELRNMACIYDTSNPNLSHCESWSPVSSQAMIVAKIVTIGIGIGVWAFLLIALCHALVDWKTWFSSSSEDSNVSSVEKFLQIYVDQTPTRYSYSQLMKITNNFADKIGEGGFGVVYKGKLPSGILVAVKMVDQSRHGENQFMNEVATIGRLHHVHLVRLMGYCYEQHRNGLVYEYMANGSLEKLIFARREREHIINWAQLYSIAFGVARGIAYLHQDCDSRIIHFDIKPHNILLDEDFTPKIADFGLAKLCGKKDDHISMTAARGTPGYVAPEVWNRNLGLVTEKSDVYSFGMLLLEMVGGRKNIDVQVSRSSQLYFPEWAFKLMENGQLERTLTGSSKTGIECEKEKAVRMAKVGLWCIQYNSTDRPSMSRVVQMLEGNGDDVSNPPLPFNSSISAAPSIHSSEESSG